MTLANYISNLLYRYDCVVVPKFGGFVTNKIPAKVNQYTHTFYPPSKQLTFNSQLQNNDGLLANYIASSEHIAFEKAIEYIEKEVDLWRFTLNNEVLELDKIGLFKINSHGNLEFEPSNSTNYLTTSFGLNTYVSPAIKRIAYNKNIKELETITPILPTKENNQKTPVFIKYAAAAAIIFALGTVGWNQYQTRTYKKLVTKAEMQQQNVEKNIQEATFVIENPLPAITLNITKETYNYHVIAGAFREPSNANKKLTELLSKGYNAKILGLNKWNLTQVAYGSFKTRNEAVSNLNIIKKAESEDAWLLVKKY